MADPVSLGQGHARGATERLSRYTDRELALIADLLDAMTEFGRAQITRIEALPAKTRRRVRIHGQVLGQKVKIEL